MGFKSIGLLVLLFCSSGISAAVVDQQERYFAIKINQALAVSAEELNAQILQIDEWWNPDHTYTGDSNNLYIDLEKECFCERLPYGGYVNHLSLVYYQPGVLFRFVGGLGPLQSIPMNGVLELRIKPVSETQSLLEVSYLVGSNSPGLKNWAGPVNRVISEQISRLAKQVEQE